MGNKQDEPNEREENSTHVEIPTFLFTDLSLSDKILKNKREKNATEDSNDERGEE